MRIRTRMGLRQRTPWSPMLILLPMVAATLALVLWGRDGRDYNDYVAAAGSNPETEASSLLRREASGGQSVAAPSMIAFPDRTCWLDLKGMEYFCFRLTWERR